MDEQASAAGEKSCAVCGRRISWRRKWKGVWDHVRFCSDGCRKRGLTRMDRALEEALSDLLHERGRGKSICPTEAAKKVGGEEWRTLLEPARMAARRLTVRGEARIIQHGRSVDPSTAKGAIRVSLP